MKPTTTIVCAALLATALLLPACGPAASGDLGSLPTDRPQQTAGPKTAAPAGPGSAAPTAGGPGESPTGAAGSGSHAREGTVTVEVWLTREGRVFPTLRTRPFTLATSRLALSELVAGPTSAEAAAGVRTTVPAGTSFDISIAGGVATVDLPQAFYDGGRSAARLRQAQVVFTLTQFPSVSQVGFQVNGEPAGAPVGPDAYDDLLPPIVVTSVGFGDQVRSPISVAGTANVFEATVSIRILDASGSPVGTAFTTATCGSGCRGDYSTAVTYRISSEQRGTLQVYEVSAEDGSPIHLVEIPITLAPSA
jgi:hypothetical protein